MKCVFFVHALSSCWNNGNAHFLRGVVRQLAQLGHEVVVYEPADGWSRQNALSDGGAVALTRGEMLIPGISLCQYRLERLELDEALDGADLVIAHEWNDASLIAALGRRRRSSGSFRLLFHDTHHRAITAPDELGRYDLDGFDGVLAFGEALREVYLRRGWGRQVFTWHEAADTDLFHPLPDEAKDLDLVWIGNWGDGERSRELHDFLIEPVTQLRLRTQLYGVRYPADIIEALKRRGIGYGGWLPNLDAPSVFARARATVHVPRGPYATALPGIPTIRVFEALACGIPLVSAPWLDCENLFPSGAYLKASNQRETVDALASLIRDPQRAAEMATRGVELVRARHTCRHRVLELFDILRSLSNLPQPLTSARDATEREAAL